MRSGFMVAGTVWCCLSGATTANAKRMATIDHGDCFCNLLPGHSFDVVIAGLDEVDGLSNYVVDEVLAHGSEVRQSVGEEVVGADYFVGDTEALGPVLIYDKQDANYRIFEVIELDNPTWREATLLRFGPRFIEGVDYCPAPFTVEAFQRFLNAYSASEADCDALAQDFLGIPHSEAPDSGCSTRGGTTWSAALVGALVLVTRRKRRSSAGCSCVGAH